MKTTLLVCLLAMTLSPAPNRDVNRSVAGTWDGNLEGVRAVTLTLRGPDRRPEGTAVFYILKDEGAGFRSGTPSPRAPLQGLHRNGDVLRFRVLRSGGRPLSFEMQITGPGYARLTRLKTREDPELTVTLRRKPPLS